jgi:hypothetical protein
MCHRTLVDSRYIIFSLEDNRHIWCKKFTEYQHTYNKYNLFGTRVTRPCEPDRVPIKFKRLLGLICSVQALKTTKTEELNFSINSGCEQ